MINIYRKAFVCFGQIWWAYILFAAMLEAMPLIETSKYSDDIGQFFGLTIFAYYLHQHFLFGLGLKTRRPTDPKNTQGSLGRFMLISGAFIVGSIILIFVVSALLSPILKAFQTPNGGPVWLGYTVLLCLMLPYLLILSFFGVALPAAAAGDSDGFSERLAQSEVTAFGVGWRLVLGPTFFVGVMNFLILPIVINFAATHGPTVPAAPAMAEFAVNMTFRLINLIGTTLAVVILCEAYRKVQPAPTPAITPL